MYYYCEECNFRFDKSATYFNHRRRRHSKYPCPDCGKVYGVKKKLAYHMRGCGETRRNKIYRDQQGMVISCSNYKRLPIVTAKELDIEFEIYMNRKFGKKGIFRNEKMCKFCSETFVMASDFADHIRNHYKSISLDATGVKSKFDFMHFMGLKIRETNDIDGSDTETANKLKHQMAQCRVVIIGERCKICSESFKCLTDLEQHKKVYHPVKKRNDIMLVLKIGQEIISRISLKKHHIRRRGVKIGSRTLKHSGNVLEKERKFNFNDGIKKVTKDCEEVREEEMTKARSAIRSEKEREYEFGLSNEFNSTDRNMKRCWRKTRGRKKEVIGVREELLETVDNYKNYVDFEDSNYDTKVRSFELGTDRIYADEYFESMQFSEPWKDEFAKGNGSWCSEAKPELNNDLINEDEEEEEEGEDCYCIDNIGPTLTPKERSSWEEEHYNNLSNDEETVDFHESPPIYKYSCDPKYQADFSFPSEEKSYGFQVKGDDIEEANNNEKKDKNKNVNDSNCTIGYKGAIIVKDEGIHLKINNSRSSDIYKYHNDKSCDLQDLETGKSSIDTFDEYQQVLIKEEIMLDDFTCCINDVCPPLFRNDSIELN